MTIIHYPARSLADLAMALAEGELGPDATAAGYAVIQWVGPDCPWFVPHPEHYAATGIDVCDFRIEEIR